MSLQPFSLLIISAVLISLSIHLACLAAFVDRQRGLYTHFAIALCGASLFIFCGHLLTGPMADSHVLMVHRLRSFGMLACLVGYQSTLCELYAPDSRLPVIFLGLSLLFLCLLPFPVFLREPPQHLPVHLLGADFHFRVASPGLGYRLYSVTVFVSFLYTLYLVLRSRTGPSRIYGFIGMAPVILGGTNDFLVAQRLLNNILVSEYFIFLFITPIYVYLLREEQRKQRRLERLNQNLEAEVAARTLELEASNRSLAEEKESLQRSLLQIRTLHGLLPICASCKNIRDDTGYWHQVEEYFRGHGDLEFTHSYCPRCMVHLYPEMYEEAPPDGTECPQGG